MLRTLITLLFINLLFSSLSNAQDWNEIYYLENEAQYQVDEKEYDKAIDIYRKMLKEIPDNFLVKYKIGLLYLLTDDQKNRAIEFLEEASQNVAKDFNPKSMRETRSPANVFYYLGKAYQINGDLDKALLNYNKFKESTDSKDELYPILLQNIQSCENAKIAIKNPKRVIIKDLGTPINNEDANFNAVLSGDGNTMVYTSYTRNYIDLFVSEKSNGTWSTPKKITEKVSSKYYLRTSSLSYDGNELYLATDDASENDIFAAYKEGNAWVDAQKLNKNINGKKSNETNACVTKDGNTLYFTSDREGGLGGLDIYKSTKDAKGSWGVPENLGPEVNTQFNEETPFVTSDGKYLFFSSEGHNTIGGYDIFYIDLNQKSNATNLGYPINTTGDDLFFVPDNSLLSGYTAKFDNKSLGKRDIYYVSILPDIYLAGNIKNNLNQEIINDDDLHISVTNTKTGEIIKSSILQNGKFNFEITPGDYQVFVFGNNYDSTIQQINIPENYSKPEFAITAYLNPVKTEEEPVLLAENDVEETPEVIETPIKQEEIIENKPEIKEEEKPVEPVVKEEKVEIKPEPKPEEKKVAEKPVEVKPQIEKEVVKYTPKTNSSAEYKTYSVQIMALKVPVDISYFKDVEGVQLKKYEDGFYRYTVGQTASYDEALKIKEKLNQIGYKQAFIRENSTTPRYTIQIMALIIPVELNYFTNLTSVVVTKGADDYYRYTIGDFGNYEDAKQELNNLKSLGYNQVFIKRVN